MSNETKRDSMSITSLVQGDRLDRLGALYEISRQDNENDEAYRNRIDEGVRKRNADVTLQVTLYMDKRTAELVQVCIEEHKAKAVFWSDEQIKLVNAVIVDLENQLTELEA